MADQNGAKHNRGGRPLFRAGQYREERGRRNQPNQGVTIVDVAMKFSARAHRSTNRLNMESKNEITFGPFFTTELVTHPVGGLLAPLNLAMEWSNSAKATRVPLFRRVLPYAPDQIRLEHIVFSRGDLPHAMECHKHLAIEAAEETFLPLEALLAALYGTVEISRSVFHLLNDLAAVVPLHSKVTNPITTKHLLVTEAEAQGFRLNAVFQESGQFYAHIAWEAECRLSRFHVCLASFRRNPNEALDKGKWMAQDEIGVSQVLTNKLHRLVPGNPAALFSGSGLQFLTAKARQTPQETDSEA